MLTVIQERQHQRVLENEGSQLMGRDPKKIEWLRYKRVILKREWRNYYD